MNKQKGVTLKITWKWMKRKIQVLYHTMERSRSGLEISHRHWAPQLVQTRVVKKKKQGHTLCVYRCNRPRLTKFMTVQVFKLIRVRFVLTKFKCSQNYVECYKKMYQKIIEEDEDKEIKGVRFLPRTHDWIKRMTAISVRWLTFILVAAKSC